MSKAEEVESKKLPFGNGASFDHITEKEEHEEKRIHDMSVAATGALAVTFLAEIAVAGATGRADFLGTANQIGEKIFNSPHKLIGFAKEMSESGLGKTVAMGLKFLGAPPVKRILKVSFAVATFTALGAASGGAIPIAAFACSMSAIAINTVRDFKKTYKMRKNVEILNKTTELKKEKARQNSIVELDPESKKLINEFIVPQSALQNVTPDGQSLRDKAIKAILPKKYADKMLENSYLRELPSTLFFNAIECSGAILTGNVYDIVSVMTMGTISENKERTEHRELKHKVKNTIAADMDALGFRSDQKFRNVEELEKAIEKQKFITDRMVKAKEDGLLTDEKSKIEIINKAIGEYKELENAREVELQNRSVFQKVMDFGKKIAKTEPVKFVQGYLNTWRPGSEVYEPEIIAEQVKKQREFHHAQIEIINDPNRKVALSLVNTLSQHSQEAHRNAEVGEAVSARMSKGKESSVTR